MTHFDEPVVTNQQLHSALIDIVEVLRHVVVYDHEEGWDNEHRLLRLRRIYGYLKLEMPDAGTGAGWLEK